MLGLSASTLKGARGQSRLSGSQYHEGAKTLSSFSSRARASRQSHIAKREDVKMSVELAVVTESQSNPKDENPYADYMWMGEEENEFDLDVLAQLEEEEYIENCFQDMLEEEALGLFTPPPVSSTSTMTSTTSLPPIQNLSIGNGNGEENGHHGNGDVILIPANHVDYESGAGGDAELGPTLNDFADDTLGKKNENASDSDSSEGSPQR
ncbi:uncharacterized protein [Diadema setosum]|uniref:uncharacterized protein isoform X1 n=2 Tax=Diadema setosum TaxID=31175 RepID=UPI003B3B1793